LNTRSLDQESRRHILVLGWSLLVPATVWLILGFAISYQIFNATLAGSLAAGFIASFMVFTIDRIIVLSRGGVAWIFRLGLALALSVMGGMVADVVFFGHDISAEMLEREIASRKSSVDSAAAVYDTANAQYLAEVDGTGGSGRYGFGTAAEMKRDNALACYQRYQLEKKALDSLQAMKLNGEYLPAASAGLLKRLKVLDDMVRKNREMRRFYWLAFFVVMMLEILPLLAKYSGGRHDPLVELEARLEEQVRREWIERLYPPDTG